MKNTRSSTKDRSFWRAHVKAQNASGLNQREYCRQKIFHIGHSIPGNAGLKMKEPDSMKFCLLSWAPSLAGDVRLRFQSMKPSGLRSPMDFHPIHCAKSWQSWTYSDEDRLGCHQNIHKTWHHRHEKADQQPFRAGAGRRGGCDGLFFLFLNFFF